MPATLRKPQNKLMRKIQGGLKTSLRKQPTKIQGGLKTSLCQQPTKIQRRFKTSLSEKQNYLILRMLRRVF